MHDKNAFAPAKERVLPGLSWKENMMALLAVAAAVTLMFLVVSLLSYEGDSTGASRSTAIQEKAAPAGWQSTVSAAVVPMQ